MRSILHDHWPPIVALLFLALAAIGVLVALNAPPSVPCKHFDVGQKVHVIAYPNEHYVVVGIGFACSVGVWRPGSGGTAGELPAALLEADPS